MRDKCLRVRLTIEESLFYLMGHHTMENGKTICLMVMVSIRCLMVLFTRVNSRKGLNLVRESFILIAGCMMVNLLMINFKEKG